MKDIIRLMECAKNVVETKSTNLVSKHAGTNAHMVEYGWMESVDAYLAVSLLIKVVCYAQSQPNTTKEFKIVCLCAPNFLNNFTMEIAGV